MNPATFNYYLDILDMLQHKLDQNPLDSYANQKWLHIVEILNNLAFV